MRSPRDEINTILSNGGGLIARRRHPELATAMSWLVRRGRLQPLLPGVYCLPALAAEPQVRIRAVSLWSPDAVLLGSAAAAVSFWPSIKVGVIELSAPTRHASAVGYRLRQCRVPVELIEERGALRYTTPARTALDLCDTVGGDGIDTALRTRASTLQHMHEALAMTTSRKGNTHRRRLLLESRDEPWSAAERHCHQLLRRAGITGWRTNVAVPGPNSVYYVDVAFEEAMVALEIDGRLHEDDPGVFESDRWRQNHLVSGGWRVFRYTWAMLQQHPEVVVQDVTAALASKPRSRRADRLGAERAQPGGSGSRTRI